MATSLCLAQLPRAGLGNKLLVWARAACFASLNGVPLATLGWKQITLGPILRGEVHRRFYSGYFKRDPLPVRVALLRAILTYERIDEPAIGRVEPPCDRRLFRFSCVPSWQDYFVGIKEHRAMVRESILAQVRENQYEAMNTLPQPTVAVHIRLGDYRTLKVGEDFSKTGAVRTPMAYFVMVISRIREVCGACVPVTVFSDGRDGELREVLDLPAVRRAPDCSDIAQMLLMARSQIIVCSAGSTFGYWAAFLADAAVVLHPDHIHGSIRDAKTNERWYEGPLFKNGFIPELLAMNIRAMGITS